MAKYKEWLNEQLGDLAPGEQRIRQDLAVKDFTKILQRIMELQDALKHNNYMVLALKNNPEITGHLEIVRKKIERKIQLLNKAQSKPTASQQKLMQTLREECSDYISQMKIANKMLFRGGRTDASVYEGRSRLDRRPADSGSEYSEVFDMMMSMLGVKALRKNSIFTTSSYNFAYNYGNTVHIIFPKNGFSFLGTTQKDLILDGWDKFVPRTALKDLMNRINDWGEQNNPNWRQSDLYFQITRLRYEDAVNVLQDNWRWDNNKLGLPDEFNITWENLVTPANIQTMFEPNTDDLVKAISNGKELLINGEYWALRYKDWHTIVDQEFFAGQADN